MCTYMDGPSGNSHLRSHNDTENLSLTHQVQEKLIKLIFFFPLMNDTDMKHTAVFRRIAEKWHIINIISISLQINYLIRDCLYS